MPVPIQFVTTSDGIRIAFGTVGGGPAIVFASNIFGDLGSYLAGWPGTAALINHLAAVGWRVVVYDVRGMGASDRNVDALDLAARVRDLTAVVEALGLDRFVLGAYDIGAATAVAYAADHPERVARLLLISPWASGAKYLQLPKLRAAYASEPVVDRDMTLFARILGSVATSFEDIDLVQLLTNRVVKDSSPAGLAAYNDANHEIEIGHLLPNVRMPTLVVHEPAFPFGSFDLCQEVAAGIPGARLVVAHGNSLAGRDHQGLIQAVTAFLPGPIPPVSTQLRKNIPSAASDLTERELEVLRHLASGSTNKEIAAGLRIAITTVERHLANLYRKIGARGRADAIAYVFRHLRPNGSD